MAWVHGPEARKSSQIAVKMIKRLLKPGFEKDTSIDLINSTISLNTEEDMYATLDITILDLYSGDIELIKNGACPTFIKSKDNNIQVIQSMSLPAGLLNDMEVIVYDKKLENGDIILMCTDGIIESNNKYENKEEWVKEILQKLNTDNPQKIADIILKEAIDNGYGKAKDDMTVIVGKVNKK